MNVQKRIMKALNEKALREYQRLEQRLREPEAVEVPDWPFVLSEQDKRFLRINRIAE